MEDALLKHPAVAECGVIGKPDEERGMIVKAFCVLKPGHAGDAAMIRTLQDHVKATIAPYKYPREIEFLAALRAAAGLQAGAAVAPRSGAPARRRTPEPASRTCRTARGHAVVSILAEERRRRGPRLS